MKKILAMFSFILVFILVSTGCSGDNSAQVRMSSQKLSSGLDQIITLTNKLDNIDTNKMDLSSFLSNQGSIVKSTAQMSGLSHDKEMQDIILEHSLLFAPLYDESSQDRTPISFNFSQKLNDCTFFEIEQSPMQFEVPSPQKFRQQSIKFNFNTKRAMKMHDDIKPCQTLANTNGRQEYTALATLSNDCKNLSQEFVTAKANVLKNCSEAKATLKKLKDSKKSISENDLRTLTSYYDVVKDCINNVKSCKSCSSNLKNINRKKTNLTSNAGAINSELLQVYNKLDANCCTLNNTTYCVNEINCFAKKLNGEDCSTNMSVNPYIRNNRYLSSLNSTKRKDFYNSQSKNQSNQNANTTNQIKLKDENNQIITQNISKNNIKRPTTTIYNTNNASKNELTYTQADKQNISSNMQNYDKNDKKVVKNDQNALATNSISDNFNKNTQKIDVNKQNKDIFNANQHKNSEKIAKNDTFSLKNEDSYNSITNNYQEKNRADFNKTTYPTNDFNNTNNNSINFENSYSYKKENNSTGSQTAITSTTQKRPLNKTTSSQNQSNQLNNTNSNYNNKPTNQYSYQPNTNPYTKDIKDKDNHLSNLRNYNTAEKTTNLDNGNQNYVEHKLSEQERNPLDNTQNNKSSNLSSNTEKNFNSNQKSNVDSNSNYNQKGLKDTTNQISSTTFNTTYTASENNAPSPSTTNNGIKNSTNYNYATLPNNDRTHPVDIGNNANTINNGQSSSAPNSNHYNRINQSNDSRSYSDYQKDRNNGYSTSDSYKVPKYRYETVKNEKSNYQSPTNNQSWTNSNTYSNYYNGYAQNNTTNYNPTKSYRTNSSFLVKPQSVRASI